MGSNAERQVKLCSLAAHLLLCGPVPNRLRAGVGDPRFSGHEVGQ